MNKMIDRVEQLKGKTIQDARLERDDDDNTGVLITTTDGDICFLTADEDRCVDTYLINSLHKWNIKLAFKLGVASQEEVDVVNKLADVELNRNKVAHALRLLDEITRDNPTLLIEFKSAFKERIP